MSKTKVGEFFLKPPIWFDVTVWSATAISIGASVAFLCLDIRGRLWAIAVYAAALLLVVFSLYLILTFRDIPERIVRNRHVKRFVADFGFRSYVLTVCSALINLLYAASGTVVAVLNNSVWLGALVWYHAVLAAARAVSVFTVGRHAKKPNFAEYKVKVYLYVGVMLNMLALATVPVVLLVVWQQNSYTFFGVALIYAIALAAYSFTKFAFSLRNFRRAHKTGDYALAATRNIGVCDALISIFALQATMFAVLDGNGIEDIMNPLTGGVVAGLIFILGVYMIVRAAVLLRRGSFGVRGAAIPAEHCVETADFADAKDCGERTDDRDGEQFVNDGDGGKSAGGIDNTESTDGD